MKFTEYFLDPQQRPERAGILDTLATLTYEKGGLALAAATESTSAQR